MDVVFGATGVANFYYFKVSTKYYHVNKILIKFPVSYDS